MATINVTVKDRITNLGIPNGIIVLYNKGTNTQTTATTNSSGVASFAGVAIGNYSVYNTYIAPNGTPPTVCGFPSGYTGTTYARRLDVNVTTAGQTTALNFNFDKPVPWSTLNGGNPPNAAIALTDFVNLATGALTAISPDIANNGMGYSTIDNMIYGSSGRSDTKTTVALNYPNSYTTSSLIGDCDIIGNFYSPVGTNSFTCIDVDPTSTTYLRALNPYTNFSEITTSPYTVSYTQATNKFDCNDWSYVPSVSGIVSPDSGANQMWILSLTTPKAYNVPVVGTAAAFTGVTFADMQDLYVPTGSQIRKYSMTTTVANGSVLSASSLSLSGDGARAVTAPVYYAQPILKKTVSEYYGATGDTLIFTVTIANTGLTTGTNTIFQDTVPDGVSFVTDSVFLNGVQQIGATPSSVNIGTLPVGQVFTVNFSAIITTNTLPAISNTANVNTNYYDQITNTNFNSTFASNTTLTTLPAPIISSTKIVNKSVATIGDILTYTVTFNNTGTTIANNLVFVDTLPNGESFIANSVTVNGTTRTGANPNPPGFTVTVPVSTLAVGAVLTVSYKATITTIPSPNPIDNTADLSYKYTANPSIPNGKSGVVTSSSAITSVAIASTAPLVKTVDLSNAVVGDVLTYTIAIPNNGTVTSFNVILSDTIPQGTSFVPNSITLNGVTQSGATIAPPTGFTVGTIPAGATSTVTFNVTVVSVPATNPIPNSATATFNAFTTTTIASNANSNIVSTTIVNATLTTTKIVSETNGFVGDTVTYTIVIKNTGNVTANNVVFVDTIPTGTSLITNSFAINGVVQSGVSPNPPGTNIQDIGPNAVVTVTFNVTVDTIPVPNPTTNISTTGYSYTLLPSTVVNKVVNSNTVATFINPDSNPLKIVSENYGSVGDTLTYTINYKNNSSLTATSVVFFDTIPAGTSFQSGSITVNGVPASGTITLPTGLSIPDIAPNSSTSIIFSVKVDTLPTINPIPNEAFFEYSDFGSPTVKSLYSNTVITEVNQAILLPATKIVNEAFAGLGDTLTYTITFYNSGNTTAINVVVIDTIPNGTTFVPNSLVLDSVTQAGSTIAPPTGFTIGTIAVGQTSTLSFQVTVVSIPTPNPTPNTATTTYDYVLYSSTGQLASGGNNTNTITTTVNYADVMTPSKAVDQVYTDIPGTLTYTITMQNIGNTTALNLVFSDTIPQGTTFVPNSVTLNGITQSGAIVEPPGFTVGTLSAGVVSTVTFQVIVATIPSPNPILNSGTTTYTYLKNPITLETGTGSGNTNTVSTTVNHADLFGSSKSVDLSYATCGDILNYIITIPNDGNVTATDVFIYDTIPSGTIFVQDSVTVNGVIQVGADPSVGVTIPSIAAGSVTTLSFMVQVQC